MNFPLPSAVEINAEQLVSRTFPDRRVNTERRVDIDPTVPNRRASDRREEVIRPAGDLRPQANALTLQAFKAEDKRFTGSSITGFGDLASLPFVPSSTRCPSELA